VSNLSEKWKREIVNLVVKKKKSAVEDKAQTQQTTRLVNDLLELV